MNTTTGISIAIAPDYHEEPLLQSAMFLYTVTSLKVGRETSRNWQPPKPITRDNSVALISHSQSSSSFIFSQLNPVICIKAEESFLHSVSRQPCEARKSGYERRPLYIKCLYPCLRQAINYKNVWMYLTSDATFRTFIMGMCGFICCFCFIVSMNFI